MIEKRPVGEIHRELARVVEGGEETGQIVSLFDEAFRAGVTVKVPDPWAPFLWWEAFKNKDGVLARAMLRVGRDLLAGAGIEAIVLLPSSMSWGEQYIRETDFPGARLMHAQRERFTDSYPIWVPSYTKKANGTRRQMGEEREMIAMYVDKAIWQAESILVVDDVLATSESLWHVGMNLNEWGGKRLYGLVGFSKNMEGGLKVLRQPRSPYQKIVACVEVTGLTDDGAGVVTRRWWER